MIQPKTPSQSLTIKIDDLPYIHYGNFKNLPQLPGVYFATLGDRVLYIGKANNLYKRWNGDHHRKEQLTAMGCDRLSYFVVPAAVALEAESTYIRMFKPELNRSPGKPNNDLIITLPEEFEHMLIFEAWLTGRSPAKTARDLLYEALENQMDAKLLPVEEDMRDPNPPAFWECG